MIIILACLCSLGVQSYTPPPLTLIFLFFPIFFSFFKHVENMRVVSRLNPRLSLFFTHKSVLSLLVNALRTRPVAIMGELESREMRKREMKTLLF